MGTKAGIAEPSTTAELSGYSSGADLYQANLLSVFQPWEDTLSKNWYFAYHTRDSTTNQVTKETFGVFNNLTAGAHLHAECSYNFAQAAPP
jgi:hypothetical protein